MMARQACLGDMRSGVACRARWSQVVPIEKTGPLPVETLGTNKNLQDPKKLKKSQPSSFMIWEFWWIFCSTTCLATIPQKSHRFQLKIKRLPTGDLHRPTHGPCLSKNRWKISVFPFGKVQFSGEPFGSWDLAWSNTFRRSESFFPLKKGGKHERKIEIAWISKEPDLSLASKFKNASREHVFLSSGLSNSAAHADFFS